MAETFLLPPPSYSVTLLSVPDIVLSDGLAPAYQESHAGRN